MSTISEFRKKLKSSPDTAKLLMPGTKYEVLLDLDGDGKMDFALIDTDHTGEIDTFAIDLQGDGEFDLYLTDTDGTGIPDKVSYYLADGDEPVKGGAAGPRLEELLRPAAMKFMVTLRSKFNAKNLVEALKNSGAYEKFSGTERGIDTPVGREFVSDGVALSVGEEQKLALARAFASDAPVVILDEPSSALDPIAERNMFDNMMRAAEGKTMIIISHRLSSAVDADRILLMESGVIAESGTHSELMEQNGKYAEMFRVQAASYVQEV